MDLSKLTILNEQYVLRKVLGKPGRYDVTHLAWNIAKEHEAVIIREYFPAHLAKRAGDEVGLLPIGEDERQLFEYGLNCFEREAAAAAMIDHPNVVRQPAYFRENGTAYTVSTYHPGATLSRVLQVQEGKLPEKGALSILMPLLNGLMAGHRKGLIHGRLSPERIFLTKSGRPMLLRFHVTQILLARRCGKVSDMSVPGYTPPELLIPEGKKGPWSDVYACAATLYSIITGLRPPEAQARMKEDPFPDILDREKYLSRGLKKVLYRAMSMECGERPQSILELKQELLDTMSPSAKPYVEYQKKPETSAISEIEESLESYPVAKTATELVSLSRRALARFKVAPEGPVITGDGGPINRNDWLTELTANEVEGVDVLQRDIPLIETNPMGPFAGDANVIESPIRLTETREDRQSTSPLNQIITSATASRTRKLSLAAVACCLFLFIVAGAWLRTGSGDGQAEMPSPARAEQQLTVLSAPEQPSYRFLMARGDSLHAASESFLARGNSGEAMRLRSDAVSVYEQLLAANPGDSVATQKLQALMLNDLREDTGEPTSTNDEESVALSREQRLLMLAEVYTTDADSLFDSGNREAAKQKYLLALEYVPELEHALSRIKQIDEERAALAAEGIFEELLRRGESLLADGNYEDARAAYEQAQRLNPDNEVLQARLLHIQTLEAEAESGEGQFQTLRLQGDSLFDAGSFSAALVNYESAQLLRPADEHLTTRIKAIKDSLNHLERLSQQLKNQYQMFRAKADSFYDALNFDEAEVHYQTALAINPNDEYINLRLQAIVDARSELESAAIDENGIFTMPDTPPELLEENTMLEQIVYPRLARTNEIEGRVIVRMIVDEQGRTSGHIIAKGIGYGCDDEAIRVLKEARFAPATYKGKPVKSWHNYPIVFRLLR